jgi:hypothetical protein
VGSTVALPESSLHAEYDGGVAYVQVGSHPAPAPTLPYPTPAYPTRCTHTGPAGGLPSSGLIAVMGGTMWAHCTALQEAGEGGQRFVLDPIELANM